MLLRDMGAPVSPYPRRRPPAIVNHKGYHRFRIAATAVVAALRIQKLQQRRQQRLQKALQHNSGRKGVSFNSQMKMSSLTSPSPALPISSAPLFSPHQQTAACHSSFLHKSHSLHNFPPTTKKSSPCHSSPQGHSHRPAQVADPQVGVYLKKLEKLQERLSSSRARHTPQ